MSNETITKISHRDLNNMQRKALRRILTVINGGKGHSVRYSLEKRTSQLTPYSPVRSIVYIEVHSTYGWGELTSHNLARMSSREDALIAMGERGKLEILDFRAGLWTDAATTMKFCHSFKKRIGARVPQWLQEMFYSRIRNEKREVAA